MAATTSQGKSFSLFMVAITAAAAGIAYLSTGAGKAALVVGAIGIAISMASFLRLKPLEGKTANSDDPTVMKIAGIVCALAGWLVVLYGIHLTASVSGRMVTTLIGLAVSLTGVIGLLPAAARKNAIWKA